MLENILRYDYHCSTTVFTHVYMRLTYTLLDLHSEDPLPTVCIKIRNRYSKSNFLLKRYTYTDTPLSEVPNQLPRIDSGSSDNINMLKFKLLPSALAGIHEPHKFILHYCCEDDDKLGFHLGITMAVSKQQDNLLMVENFNLKIEMHYIDENSRQIISNSSVKYNARIFVEDGKYDCVDYLCKEFSDVSHPEFIMTVRHRLVSNTSPDSMVDLDIVSLHSQS
jgi:hypothetical protein